MDDCTDVETDPAVDMMMTIVRQLDSLIASSEKRILETPRQRHTPSHIRALHLGRVRDLSRIKAFRKGLRLRILATEGDPDKLGAVFEELGHLLGASGQGRLLHVRQTERYMGSMRAQLILLGKARVLAPVAVEPPALDAPFWTSSESGLSPPLQVPDASPIAANAPPRLPSLTSGHEHARGVGIAA